MFVKIDGTAERITSGRRNPFSWDLEVYDTLLYQKTSHRHE